MSAAAAPLPAAGAAAQPAPGAVAPGGYRRGAYVDGTPAAAAVRVADGTRARRAVRARELARLVRAVTAGLVEPGAAEAVDQERALAAALRARPRQPRVVAFLSGKGGTGTSVTAAGVGLTLAALRADDPVLVDAQAGTMSLAARVAGRPAPTVTDVTHPEHPAQPLATHAGLRIVDAVPRLGQLPLAEVRALLDALAPDRSFTLLDLGDDAGPATEELLRRVDCAVVVTGVSEDEVDAARHTVDLLAGDRQPLPVVVAVVCRRGSALRRVGRLRDVELSGHASRVVIVPHDRELASGRPIAPGRLGPRTRAAYLTLAALIAAAEQPARPAAEPALSGGW